MHSMGKSSCFFAVMTRFAGLFENSYNGFSNFSLKFSLLYFAFLNVKWWQWNLIFNQWKNCQRDPNKEILLHKPLTKGFVTNYWNKKKLYNLSTGKKIWQNQNSAVYKRNKFLVKNIPRPHFFQRSDGQNGLVVYFTKESKQIIALEAFLLKATS